MVVLQFKYSEFEDILKSVFSAPQDISIFTIKLDTTNRYIDFLCNSDEFPSQTDFNVPTMRVKSEVASYIKNFVEKMKEQSKNKSEEFNIRSI